jgi:hypothetical protein
MAVWLTTGFFEVAQARVDAGGQVYSNSFTCIPDSVPGAQVHRAGVLVQPGTPLVVAIPPGPLFERFQAALKAREILPYLEVRLVGGKVGDTLRLNRVRVTGLTPLTAEGTRQVTIVAES